MAMDLARLRQEIGTGSRTWPCGHDAPGSCAKCHENARRSARHWRAKYETQETIDGMTRLLAVCGGVIAGGAAWLIIGYWIWG